MLFLRKQYTTGAGLAVAFGLTFSHPALSASVSQAHSTQGNVVPRLHQGDLVRLRSGGPLMTIDAVSDDQVECVWTGENGQTDDATFPAKVLQKF